MNLLPEYFGKIVRKFWVHFKYCKRTKEKTGKILI